MSKVAIGFKVRTGRATAVVIGGRRASPIALSRRALALADPAVPDSGAPFHLGLGGGGAAAERAVRRAADAARAASIRAVCELVREVGADGHDVVRVGLVVGSLVDPERLPNLHVRAHASEGKLFREGVEAGAAAAGVPSRTHLESRLLAEAARAMGRTETELKRSLTDLGRPLGRPWRVEEKNAALAGWLALPR